MTDLLKDTEAFLALDGKRTPGEWRKTSYQSGTQNVEFPGSTGTAVVDEVLDGADESICASTSVQPWNGVGVSHRKEDAGDEGDAQRWHNGNFIAACSGVADLLRRWMAECERLRAENKRLLYHNLTLWSRYHAQHAKWSSKNAHLRKLLQAAKEKHE